MSEKAKSEVYTREWAGEPEGYCDKSKEREKGLCASLNVIS